MLQGVADSDSRCPLYRLPGKNVSPGTRGLGRKVDGGVAPDILAERVLVLTHQRGKEARHHRDTPLPAGLAGKSNDVAAKSPLASSGR